MRPPPRPPCPPAPFRPHPLAQGVCRGGRELDRGLPPPLWVPVATERTSTALSLSTGLKVCLLSDEPAAVLLWHLSSSFSSCLCSSTRRSSSSSACRSAVGRAAVRGRLLRPRPRGSPAAPRAQTPTQALVLADPPAQGPLVDHPSGCEVQALEGEATRSLTEHMQESPRRQTPRGGAGGQRRKGGPLRSEAPVGHG